MHSTAQHQRHLHASTPSVRMDGPTPLRPQALTCAPPTCLFHGWRRWWTALNSPFFSSTLTYILTRWRSQHVLLGPLDQGRWAARQNPPTPRRQRSIFAPNSCARRHCAATVLVAATLERLFGPWLAQRRAATVRPCSSRDGGATTTDAQPSPTSSAIQRHNPPPSTRQAGREGTPLLCLSLAGPHQSLSVSRGATERLNVYAAQQAPRSLSDAAPAAPTLRHARVTTL